MSELQQDDPVLVDALMQKIAVLKFTNESIRRDRDDLRRQLTYEREQCEKERQSRRKAEDALESKVVPLVKALENHLGVSIYDEWSE